MDVTNEIPDQYLLGDELIDDQHRMMLTMLRTLECSESPAEIRGLMMKLYMLVREHFVDEEALMERCGYPLREEHAREHARVLVEMDRFAKQLFANGIPFAQLKEKLEVDVVGHLLAQDRLLGTFLRGGGTLGDFAPFAQAGIRWPGGG